MIKFWFNNAPYFGCCWVNQQKTKKKTSNINNIDKQKRNDNIVCTCAEDPRESDSTFDIPTGIGLKLHNVVETILVLTIDKFSPDWTTGSRWLNVSPHKIDEEEEEEEAPRTIRYDMFGAGRRTWNGP